MAGLSRRESPRWLWPQSAVGVLQREGQEGIEFLRFRWLPIGVLAVEQARRLSLALQPRGRKAGSVKLPATLQGASCAFKVCQVGTLTTLRRSAFLK